MVRVDLWDVICNTRSCLASIAGMLFNFLIIPWNPHYQSDCLVWGIEPTLNPLIDKGPTKQPAIKCWESEVMLSRCVERLLRISSKLSTYLPWRFSHKHKRNHNCSHIFCFSKIAFFINRCSQITSTTSSVGGSNIRQQWRHSVRFLSIAFY